MRYLHTYGTRTEKVLAKCNSAQCLGAYFGDGLYQVEVDFLVTNEWATCVEDILWRRTKIGLSCSQNTRDNLSNYLQGMRNKME